MINVKEDQSSRDLGLIRRKVIWTRQIKGASHHSPEIVIREIHLKMNLE
jgi:hypothetical protein